MSESSFRSSARVGIAATAGACAAARRVGVQSVPSTEAVRLRNALLIETPSATVGQWQPDSPRPGFLSERRPVPLEIAQRSGTSRRIPPVGPGELAQPALVAHLLATCATAAVFARTSVETTYRAIVEEGRGYCSDYIDVFVALAHAVGIPVRSWAFSFDGFGGRTHSGRDLRSALGQWIMLDVFNNVHPVSRVGRPLSVSSSARVRGDPNSVEFVPDRPGRVAYAMTQAA
jgi:hypothetical protein